MKNLLMTLVALLFSSGLPTYAAVDTNMSFPVTIAVFIPCAVGGAGEVVTLNGNLHVLISTTVNGNHISSDMHFQPQGINGVGSVSAEQIPSHRHHEIQLRGRCGWISVHPNFGEQFQGNRARSWQ